MTELIGLKYREVTDVTLGTFYDAYNELGFGFLESVYREAMAIALFEKGCLLLEFESCKRYRRRL